MAIGAIHANSPDGVHGVSQVRIFRYRAKDDEWLQLGKTVYGKDEFDQLGRIVSMAVEWSRVVISASLADTACGRDSGTIRIFEVKNL